jgi:hypothetical protein
MSKILKAVFEILFAWKTEQTQGKSPLKSKTVWVLIVSAIGLCLGNYAGMELSANEQTAIITSIGIVMRLISKQPVGFWKIQRPSS